jgi:hypothetical protein
MFLRTAGEERGSMGVPSGPGGMVPMNDGLPGVKQGILGGQAPCSGCVGGVGVAC